MTEEKTVGNSQERIVKPFEEQDLLTLIGKSEQAKNIFKYLNDPDPEFHAKTMVIEHNYVDKSYLIDYQKFYSRSFEPIGKLTERIHFFSEGFSNENFDDRLRNYREDKTFHDSYLGFVVVRPITDLYGNNLIGRTLLKAKSKKEDKSSFYIKPESRVSLFGHEFEIEALPFQAQDQGVAACATIALWTTLEGLPKSFGVPELSAAEITEKATEIPSFFRRFPQTGLTGSQITGCIASLGLDSEFIYPDDSHILPVAIKAYCYAKIPLIASLKLTLACDNSTSLHAAVISGYQSTPDGKIAKLFIHDDQIGPYSITKPKSYFRIWENSWNLAGYNKIELEYLIAPVYHKIRLQFSDIYLQCKKIMKKLETEQPNQKMDLYLTTVQDYKRDLIKMQFKQKVEKLQTQLPHFLWVQRFTIKGKEDVRHQDDVFDATATFSKKPLITIEYD